MLDITFRTDELTAREMQIAVSLDRPGYNPAAQIEFILLRAVPGELSCDDLCKALWQEPASRVSALYNTAFAVGMEKTLAAMMAVAQLMQEENIALALGRDCKNDKGDIFDQAAKEGLEM